jgi:hypothetical protein
MYEVVALSIIFGFLIWNILYLLSLSKEIIDHRNRCTNRSTSVDALPYNAIRPFEIVMNTEIGDCTKKMVVHTNLLSGSPFARTVEDLVSQRMPDESTYILTDMFINVVLDVTRPENPNYVILNVAETQNVTPPTNQVLSSGMTCRINSNVVTAIIYNA